MKKGFTLIEVLISAIIVFTAVMAIIGASSNIKFMINNLLNSDLFALKASVALIEQKDVKNLYEQLVDFNITDDDIIRELKKSKISFEATQTTTENNLTIDILKAYSKNYSTTVYGLGMK